MTHDLYTLPLEPGDDHVSIRDALTFVNARRVALLLPPGVPVFRRRLDLLLVQRQAARLGLELSLITDNFNVMEYARALGISVFTDEQTAARARWKRPRHHDPAAVPNHDPTDQADIATRVAVLRGNLPLPPGAQRRRTLLRGMLVLLLFGSLVLGFLLAAPSATVRVTPANRQVFETVTIIADPALADIDIEQFSMPAAVVSLQATARVTVQSSGREDAGTSLAQGLVTFTNTSDAPVLLPAGTIVATSGTFPVRFQTLIETTLVAGTGATVQVPIQALEAHAGPDGNVDPGTINRIESGLDADLTVTNANATYGGAVQQQPLVTDADHDRLLVLGRQQVLQNARDTLLHQLTGDQFLVPGSVTITQERPEWTLYSHVVGDIAASVSLDLRAQVQAVVVDERQARQVAYAGLAPYLQPGLEIAPNALAYTRGDIVAIEPTGRVTFLMTVSGNIAVSIDEDHVRERVLGVTVSEARARLERELLLDPQRPPQIDAWPGWLGRMPLIPVRVAVEIESP